MSYVGDQIRVLLNAALGESLRRAFDVILGHGNRHSQTRFSALLRARQACFACTAGGLGVDLSKGAAGQWQPAANAWRVAYPRFSVSRAAVVAQSGAMPRAQIDNQIDK